MNTTEKQEMLDRISAGQRDGRGFVVAMDEIEKLLKRLDDSERVFLAWKNRAERLEKLMIKNPNWREIAS